MRYTLRTHYCTIIVFYDLHLLDNLHAIIAQASVFQGLTQTTELYYAY